jgi:putative transcriptional regulator
MTTATVPASLRELRRERGWSQQDLAGRANVSQSMISAVEAGRKHPGDGIAKALAAALGVTVTAFRAGRCGHCEGAPPDGYSCMTCGKEGATP